MTMSNLPEIFSKYFDVITDHESWVMDEAFKLRYQVYCVEQGFEDASQFEDKREFDEFDCRAAHGIVCHRRSETTAATVRLVLPDPKSPEALFPIEMHCGNALRRHLSILTGVPRHAIAEISRFAVSKNFKRRLGECESVAGVAPDHDEDFDRDLGGKRVIPHLILGLFAAIVKMSAERKITHWYAVMDVSLLRLLSRFGINFVPVGDMVDYHGLRQPCFRSVDEVLAGIWHKRFDVWQLITADGTVWPAPGQNQVLRVSR
jgi:N-acyl amino acid synthase of PEP-CTERM/exosortase system